MNLDYHKHERTLQSIRKAAIAKNQTPTENLGTPPYASSVQSRSPTPDRQTSQTFVATPETRSPNPNEQTTTEYTSNQMHSTQSTLLTPQRPSNELPSIHDIATPISSTLPRRVFRSHIPCHITDSSYSRSATTEERAQPNRRHMIRSVIRNAFIEQMQMIRQELIKEIDKMLEETRNSLE